MPTVGRAARTEAPAIGSPDLPGPSSFDRLLGPAPSPGGPAGPSADADPIGSGRLGSDGARPAGAVATLLAPATRIQRSTLATHPLLPTTHAGHPGRAVRAGVRSDSAFGRTVSPTTDVAPLAPSRAPADTATAGQPVPAGHAEPLEVLQRAWSGARPRRTAPHRALLGPPDQAPPPPPDSPPQPAESAAMPEPETASPATRPEGAARPGSTLEPTELDLLAGKLLDPLLRRLRQELLLDRERRGHRVDRR